jgi:radical SAM superfamily enzyme YgiQ (UPF0313 family)
LFVIPVETVLADARQQVARGARHITFGDPDFLNGPGHALAAARALHSEFPSVTFDFTAKIEHLLKHQQLLPELAALGCLFVVSAVESLSDRVLALLDKGHTRADADRALDLCRAAGITLRPSLLAFTPWTTLADYLEMLDWIERRELVDQVEPIHLALRLLVPPGSLLLERPELEVERFDAERLTYVWTHPDARMDELQRAVLAAVEAGARAGEDAPYTFARVRALARAAATGRPLVDRALAAPSGRRRRAPRLTEAWFC